MCVTAQIAPIPLPDTASLPVSFSYRDLRLWKWGWQLQAESLLFTRRNTMKRLFNRKQTGLAVACALTLGILSGAAFAQNPDGKAYLHDA
jgi:hypothetical protein